MPYIEELNGSYESNQAIANIYGICIVKNKEAINTDDELKLLCPHCNVSSWSESDKWYGVYYECGIGIMFCPNCGEPSICELDLKENLT